MGETTWRRGKWGVRTTLVVLVSIALGCSRGGADLVFRGGGVYTVDAANPWAEAVAVDSGRIVYVGSDAGVHDYVGAATEVWDLKGRMLLPGFIDSHTHPILGATLEAMCRLDDARSERELLELIADCDGQDDEDWLLAFGWRSSLFFPEIAPHRTQLDAVVSDRPAVMIAKDMHTFWLNSRALEAAGIDVDTQTPRGGEIVRDPDGSPAGALRDRALDLVMEHAPTPGVVETLLALRATLREMNRHGYTSMMDARSIGTEYALAYRALDLLGQLRLRVTLAQLFDPHGEDDGAQLERFSEIRDDYTSSWLRPNIVKIFVDGGTAVRSSASAPYMDGTPAYEPYLSAAQLKSTVAKLDELGFATHLHTLGDRATRIALDAIAEARATPEGTGARHAITHLVYPDPADVERFSELEVIANISPWWAFENEWTESFLPTLGAKRSKWLYPFRTLEQQGVRISAGSDYPFTPMSPFEAIEVGLTRQDPKDSKTPPLVPDQAMTLAGLIRAFTLDAAYQLHQEATTGSIEVDKEADLIVVDRNLFEIPASDLSDTQVLLTVLAGEVVFSAQAQP